MQKAYLSKITILFILLLAIPTMSISQEKLHTKFEKTKGQETVTYQEGISYFTLLANEFPEIEIREGGATDSGYPLHVVFFSVDKDFDIASLRRKQKTIILINNAIHPGEPDGVDASMLLLRSLAEDPSAKKKYKDVVLAIIPFYNIGGALNRGRFSRANQNGPTAYGFRGNARNLDLNRDFIKNDSKNAQSFAALFHSLDPDIFIDNHVSNGADYQYTMTMLATQQDKLGGALGKYLQEDMMPKLERMMAAKKQEMIPYVNVWGTTPDNGYEQFIDLPRYSSGYTTLFHTLGFVPETHMLKPYLQRVEATYAFMEVMLDLVAEDGAKIKQLRKETKAKIISQEMFEVDWILDKEKSRKITFKGYEGEYKESKVTGQKRLQYNRKKPFTKQIDYFDHFTATKLVKKPQAYIIPQGWHQVIDRLKLNQVAMEQIESDSIVEVEAYYIADYKTVDKPYEGHYLHYETQVRPELVKIQLLRGDFIIYTNQVANRYLVETLEPTAPDSFFNWNFFDTILQQKEGFSDYVFEDVAWELLQQNPTLQKEFNEKKQADPEFMGSARAQLNFIYIHSPYYESAHLQYPIYRML